VSKDGKRLAGAAKASFVKKCESGGYVVLAHQFRELAFGISRRRNADWSVSPQANFATLCTKAPLQPQLLSCL
jgi:hypothetical protein